jgi:hypothetical protein
MVQTAGIYNSIVTEAASITEPVTLQDAKDWMRVDHDDDDDLIDSMIVSARQDIEGYCQIKLVDASVIAWYNVKDSEEEYSQFPGAIRQMIDDGSLLINYLVKGEADELQVIDEDYYFDHSLSFASTGRFKVEYDIVAASIPETLKEAIKMLVAYRYQNRGDQDKGLQQGIPEDVISKVYKYAQIWL